MRAAARDYIFRTTRLVYMRDLYIAASRLGFFFAMDILLVGSCIVYSRGRGSESLLRGAFGHGFCADIKSL